MGSTKLLKRLHRCLGSEMYIVYIVDYTYLCLLHMQAAVGSRFEDVYKSTQLKQERGARQEVIREEVFQAFANGQGGAESQLVATAIGAAGASLGGVGGLGPSTSKPPAYLGVNANADDKANDTVVDPPTDLTDKKAQETAASSIGDMPSIPPSEEAAEDSKPSSSRARNPSVDKVTKPIIETGIGAAAMGLGGVGGLGKSNSEPDMEGEEEAGVSGRVLPMGSFPATPAQVSRALKVRQLASMTTFWTLKR